MVNFTVKLLFLYHIFRYFRMYSATSLKLLFTALILSLKPEMKYVLQFSSVECYCCFQRTSTIEITISLLLLVFSPQEKKKEEN